MLLRSTLLEVPKNYSKLSQQVHTFTHKLTRAVSQYWPFKAFFWVSAFESRVQSSTWQTGQLERKSGDLWSSWRVRIPSALLIFSVVKLLALWFYSWLTSSKFATLGSNCHKQMCHCNCAAWTLSHKPPAHFNWHARKWALSCKSWFLEPMRFVSTVVSSLRVPGWRCGVADDCFNYY